MEGGGLQESYHMVSLLRRGLHTCIYFENDNLLHAISKLQYVLFHVVITSFLYTSTLSNTVHRVNTEIRPCVKRSVTRG